MPEKRDFLFITKFFRLLKPSQTSIQGQKAKKYHPEPGFRKGNRKTNRQYITIRLPQIRKPNYGSANNNTARI